jgi:hypothetical protein
MNSPQLAVVDLARILDAVLTVLITGAPMLHGRAPDSKEN